jgi:hypothetical protein
MRAGRGSLWVSAGAVALAVFACGTTARAQTIPTKIVNPKHVPYAITQCSVTQQPTPVTTTLQFHVLMVHTRIPGAQIDTTVGEVTFVYTSGQTASRLITPLNATTASLITLSSYGMTITHARCALAFYNHPIVAVGVPEYLAPWISPDWNQALPLPPVPTPIPIH